MSLPVGLGRHRAVAQHHREIGDLEGLLEVMGDIDDRYAARLEVPDDLEQHLDLGGAQRRGRLVHDEDAGVHGERAGDLDDLLLAEPQVLDQRHRVDVLLEFGHQGAGLTGLLGVVDAGRRAQLPAHEDVVAHAEVGCEAQLLVDDRDAAVPRIGGRRERDGAAVELDEAGGRLDDAGQDLHQRRLAGAVLAEQRGDLAAPDVEVHALQGMDTAVGFRHVAGREHDVAGCGSGRGCGRRALIISPPS